LPRKVEVRGEPGNPDGAVYHDYGGKLSRAALEFGCLSNEVTAAIGRDYGSTTDMLDVY
jgi:hypothetical protein